MVEKSAVREIWEGLGRGGFRRVRLPFGRDGVSAGGHGFSRRSRISEGACVFFFLFLPVAHRLRRLLAPYGPGLSQATAEAEFPRSLGGRLDIFALPKGDGCESQGGKREAAKAARGGGGGCAEAAVRL